MLCGPSTAATVTALSPAPRPNRLRYGGHGLAASFSAKHQVYFAGEPCVARSVSPGSAPPTFIIISRRARPMVALARLPGPKQPAPLFMPICSASSPWTITSSAHGCVVVCMPKRLNIPSCMRGDGRLEHRHVLRQAAGHDGVGGQVAHREGRAARRDVTERVVRLRAAQPAHIRSTRSTVGTTIGQAVGPPPREQLLGRLVLVAVDANDELVRAGSGPAPSCALRSRVVRPGQRAARRHRATSAVTRSWASLDGMPPSGCAITATAQIPGVALPQHLSREAIELIGRQADHRQPSCRELNHVVATPRRARASIEARDDDRVAVAGDLVEQVRLRAERRAPAWRSAARSRRSARRAAPPAARGSRRRWACCC